MFNAAFFGVLIFVKAFVLSSDEFLNRVSKLFSIALPSARNPN